MNKVILMGRLTKDPELRQSQNGISVARFTIAVNRRFAKDGQQQADFINCVAWRQTGEFIAKYFEKGSKSESGTKGNNTDFSDSSIDDLNSQFGDDFATIGGDEDDDLPF